MSLKELRKSKGLSQEKLSELSGVSRITISLLENGMTNPTLDTLAKVSKALDISPSAIIKADSPHSTNEVNLNVSVPNFKEYERKVKELSQVLKKANSLLNEIRNYKLEVKIDTKP